MNESEVIENAAGRVAEFLTKDFGVPVVESRAVASIVTAIVVETIIELNKKEEGSHAS